MRTGLGSNLGRFEPFRLPTTTATYRCAARPLNCTAKDYHRVTRTTDGSCSARQGQEQATPIHQHLRPVREVTGGSDEASERGAKRVPSALDPLFLGGSRAPFREARPIHP